MSFNYLYRVKIGKKDFSIKELSFIDYKNFCKSVFNQLDHNELDKEFNKLISTCVSEPPSTVLEKIILLAHIRGLTLGQSVQINYNGKIVSIDNNMLIDSFNKPYNYLEYTCNEFELVFDIPVNFTSGVIKSVCEGIIEIRSKDKTYSLGHMTQQEKDTITLAMPGLPFGDIFKIMTEYYSFLTFTVPQLEGFEINIFDPACLLFFKFIFDEQFSAVLDMEYNLRRHLHFNTYDLERISYPECKIMLNKFGDEMKEKEKNPLTGHPGANT